MTTATAQAVDLSGYSESARHAIEFEAEVWLYGDVARAARIYDQAVAWGRKLSPGNLELHAAGAWQANQLLKLAALCEVRARRAYKAERARFYRESQTWTHA